MKAIDKAIKKNIDRLGYKLPFDNEGRLDKGLEKKLEKALFGEKVGLSYSDRLNIEAYINYAESGEVQREADILDRRLGWDL